MKNIFKRVALIFAFMMVSLSSVLLVACGGGDNGGNNNPSSPTVRNVEVVYKDNTYNFDQNQPGGIKIPYSENLNFSIADFSVRIEYVENIEPTIIDATNAGASVVFYKSVYNEQTGINDWVVANNFEPGSYEIRIEYQNQSYNTYFDITAYDITDANKLNVVYENEHTFVPSTDNWNIGTEIVPEVAVYYNSVLLVENVDYVITYSNNFDVSTAQTPEEQRANFVILGMGKYAGEKKFYFNINKVQIEQITPTESVINTSYVPGISKIDLVKNNLPELPAGVYSNVRCVVRKGGVVVYDDQGLTPDLTDVGTYDIEYHFNIETASFDYPYANPTAQLVIAPINISNYFVATDYAVTYKGSAYATNTTGAFSEQDINLSTTQGGEPISLWNMTLTMLADGTELGNGVVVDNTNVSNASRKGALQITPNNANYTGTKVFTYTIVSAGLNSNTQITLDPAETSIVYDGNEHHPVAQVTWWNQLDGEYVDLALNIDYTVSYSADCTNVGEKTITITGIGNFSSDSYALFNITKASINISDEVAFAASSVTYNGLDQAEQLLVLNTNLDDVLEIHYTKVANYGNQNATPVGQMKNAGIYTIYVTINLIAAQQNNYNLYGKVNFNQNIEIVPVVVTSVAYDTQTVNSFDGGSGTSLDPYYYTYSGNSFSPKIVATATVSGQTYTLVENTDYTLSYLCDYDLMTPENVGHYNVRINYDVGGVHNFAYAQFQGYYDYFDDELEFEIRKATMTNAQIAQISWPTVYKYVWQTKAFFDLANATRDLYGQTITIDTKQIDCDFALERTSIYGNEDTWVDANNRINIICSTDNYEDVTHQVNVTVEKLFTKFELNGTELSAAQMEALSALAFGDTIAMTLPDGYTITYKEERGGVSPYSTTDDDMVVVVGSGTNNGKPVVAELVSFTVKKTNNDSVTGKIINSVAKNIFAEYAVYDENMDLLQNLTFDYYLDGWLINEDDTLKVQMNSTNYAGYTVTYEVVCFDNELGPQGVAESAKATSIQYKMTAIDNYVVVRIYNANDDLIVALVHNVNHNFNSLFNPVNLVDSSTNQSLIDLYSAPLDYWQTAADNLGVIVQNGQRLEATLANSTKYCFDFVYINEAGTKKYANVNKITTGQCDVLDYIADNDFGNVVEFGVDVWCIYNAHYYFVASARLMVAHTQQLMSVSLNPELEFVIGEYGKVKSVSARNDEGNYILYLAGDTISSEFVVGAQFIGKTPEEAIELFLDLMEDNGYVVPQSEQATALTITYSDGAKLDELKSVGDAKAQERNLNLTIGKSTTSKADIAATVAEYYKEYSATDIENMTQDELMNLLFAVKTKTNNYENNYLKDLYKVARAHASLYAKYQKIHDIIINDDNLFNDSDCAVVASQIETILNGLSTFDTFVETYENMLLKSSSMFNLVRVSMIELKQNILFFKQSGQTAMAEQLEAQLAEIENSLQTIGSSISTMMDTIANTLTNMNTNLEEQYALVFSKFSKAQKDAVGAYVSAQLVAFESDFETNYADKYNANLWVKQGIRAEGTIVYVYANENDTYSFNRDDSNNGMACYVYYGVWTAQQLAGKNPYAAYMWSESDSIVSISNSQHLMFVVDQGVLTPMDESPESTVVPEGTIVYLWQFDMGMEGSATYSFNDNNICYIYFGAYTAQELQGGEILAVISGEWSQEGYTLTLQIAGDTVTFTVDGNTLTPNM